MTPEQFSEHLQEILGQKLRSAVLFGSAVSGDQTKHFSNFNVLVVVEDLNPDTLKSLMPLVKKWRHQGNPSPLLFTERNLADSRDVFPIEFLDIQSNRRILFGKDPFAELIVSMADFRHQLEYELRGKLTQLRSLFLETEGKEARIRELLARFLSSVHVLFRATLRMMGEKVPDHKLELWKALKVHISLDVEALEEIFLFREGQGRGVPSSAGQLFSRFLQNIEAVVQFVDHYKNNNKEHL